MKFAWLAILAVLISVVLPGSHDVIGTGRRDEIARRTQCHHNMKVIGDAIAAYKGRTGDWPLTLEKLNLDPLLLCPSAFTRRGQLELSGKYVWDPSTHVLSEDEKNHDARRLGLRNYSNAVQIVVLNEIDRPEVTTKWKK